MDSAGQIISLARPEEQIWFTKLDLNYAYSQLLLSDKTSKHCNFNIVGGSATGTYRFKTGFYGLTDMPTEFQKAMDRTLDGCLNTLAYLDDVLIVSFGSLEKHNELVEKVLKRLFDERFSLGLHKCEFSVHEIEWLGFTIDREGARPVRSKIEDVLNIKPPKTLTQLRAFQGSVNHLNAFIKDAQVHTAKFKDSLKASNKQKFYWSDVQTEMFNELLKLMTNITSNYHYSTARETRLKRDASKSGLGACLE